MLKKNELYDITLFPDQKAVEIAEANYHRGEVGMPHQVLLGDDMRKFYGVSPRPHAGSAEEKRLAEVRAYWDAEEVTKGAAALKAQADMERLNARVAAKEKAKASSPAPVQTVNLKDIPADLPLDPQTQIAIDQHEAASKLLDEKLNSLSNNKEDWENLLLYGTAGLALAGGGAAIGKSTEPSEEEIIAAYLARQS
jgi:hypothetical protein